MLWQSQHACVLCVSSKDLNWHWEMHTQLVVVGAVVHTIAHHEHLLGSLFQASAATTRQHAHLSTCRPCHSFHATHSCPFQLPCRLQLMTRLFNFLDDGLLLLPLLDLTDHRCVYIPTCTVSICIPAHACVWLAGWLADT